MKKFAAMCFIAVFLLCSLLGCGIVPGGRIRISSVYAGYANTFAITVNGELWAWGCNEYGQLGLGENSGIEYQYYPVKVMDNVAQVSVGESHAMAIRRNGELWAWGCNEYGQLGLGKNSGI